MLNIQKTYILHLLDVKSVGLRVAQTLNFRKVSTRIKWESPIWGNMHAGGGRACGLFLAPTLVSNSYANLEEKSEALEVEVRQPEPGEDVFTAESEFPLDPVPPAVSDVERVRRVGNLSARKRKPPKRTVFKFMSDNTDCHGFCMCAICPDPPQGESESEPKTQPQIDAERGCKVAPQTVHASSVKVKSARSQRV